jgi:hypothetical protein
MLEYEVSKMKCAKVDTGETVYWSSRTTNANSLLATNSCLKLLEGKEVRSCQ